MHAPAAPWPVVDAPELAALVRDADHVDVASTTAAASVAEFITTALSWEPAWLRALYRARAVLARELRLDHPDLSASTDPHDQTLSLVPGTPLDRPRVLRPHPPLSSPRGQRDDAGHRPRS